MYGYGKLLNYSSDIYVTTLSYLIYNKKGSVVAIVPNKKYVETSFSLLVSCPRLLPPSRLLCLLYSLFSYSDKLILEVKKQKRKSTGAKKETKSKEQVGENIRTRRKRQTNIHFKCHTVWNILNNTRTLLLLRRKHKM